MNSERINSYYSATVNDNTQYPKLEQDIKTDVAIIGGGFSGVSTAIFLAERGFEVALLEANRIGWGASGRNGGQITGSLSGEQVMLKQLNKKMDSEAENFIWQLGWRGHKIIKQRVEKYSIECDLTHGHLIAAYKPSHMKSLCSDYEYACQRGMENELTLLKKDDIPQFLEASIYFGGLRNQYNMHVHSLNLCLGEAQAAASLGVQIFEQTHVIDIQYGNQPVILTDTGRVKSDAVIIAGNAYHKLGRSKLSGMLYPAILGNLTTKPLGELADKINPYNLAVYDSRYVLDYYRLTADKRLMFGGGANYSGKNIDNVAGTLRPSIEKTFPRLKNIEIEFEWTCKAGIVINRIPQLGMIDENVYYIQGYSGHGIATSHVLSEILADALIGKLEKFDTFSQFKQIRLPFGERFGKQMLAIGMWYYQIIEKLR